MGKIQNNIKLIRKSRNINQTKLAEIVGSTISQIGKLERGERALNDKWIERLSKALNCEPYEIIADSKGWKDVSLIGYVGAGQEIIPYDDLENGDDTVEAPAILGDVAAVIVKGDSMFPAYHDGDTIIFDRKDSGLSMHIGRECVVKLADGRALIKTLQKGGKPSTFTLMSHNAPPINNVVVMWARPVVWIKRG